VCDRAEIAAAGGAICTLVRWAGFADVSYSSSSFFNLSRTPTSVSELLIGKNFDAGRHGWRHSHPFKRAVQTGLVCRRTEHAAMREERILYRQMWPAAHFPFLQAFYNNRRPRKSRLKSCARVKSPSRRVPIPTSRRRPAVRSIPWIWPPIASARPQIRRRLHVQPYFAPK